MQSKIRKIAERNGFFQVRSKAKEELQELIDAIEENDDDKVLDEVADVFIMLVQLIIVYKLETLIDHRIDFKIDRTFNRLKIDEN